MQKKPAVLLEILIALTLMILVLVPLIQKPMQFHKAEKERIQRIEASRIAAWTYSEIREKFMKGEFRWEEIPALTRESKIYELPSVPLLLPPVADKSVRRSFRLQTIREKEHEGKISRLIAIEIKVDGHRTTYRLIVEKKDPLFFNSALLH
jgi:hypothetical protein